MGYAKGTTSRERIIESSVSVVLEKGFSATTMADLTQAANTSVGKFTHHFPSKEALFEALFGRLLDHFEAGPLALLGDRKRSPIERITGFLDGIYALYAIRPAFVGCPIGHAAGDSGGVTVRMKERTLQFLNRTATLFERAFREMQDPPDIAKAKAALFVNAWQGSVVVAKAGGGLRHVRSVLGSLKTLAEYSPAA
jgi:TetR/AcrR family transcriptional repressor of nem operon